MAIIPWWPRRGWFPLVLQLLVDLPVLLPEVDEFIFAVSHISAVQTGLCLFTGTWLKRITTPFLSGEFLPFE